MIVNCPNCRKPMSSKAPLCPACGFERGDVPEEQLFEFQRRRLRDRIYRWKMANYAAITLLLVAAGWYFFQTANLDFKPSVGPMILVGIGAVFYVTCRAMLFRAKRDLKRLKLS